MRGVKPDGAMKTLSGTFTFKLIVLAAIGLLAGLTLRAFAQTPTGTIYVLEIKGNPYVELKNSTVADFKNLLNTIDKDGANGTKVTIKEAVGEASGPPFTSVVTSGSATSATAGAGSGIRGSAHGTQVAGAESTTEVKGRVQVTQRVATSSAADLKKVVGSF